MGQPQGLEHGAFGDYALCARARSAFNPDRGRGVHVFVTAQHLKLDGNGAADAPVPEQPVKAQAVQRGHGGAAAVVSGDRNIGRQHHPDRHRPVSARTP